MGLDTVCVGSGAVLVCHGSHSAVYISEPARLNHHSQAVSSKEALRQVWP